MASYRVKFKGQLGTVGWVGQPKRGSALVENEADALVFERKVEAEAIVLLMRQHAADYASRAVWEIETLT